MPSRERLPHLTYGAGAMRDAVLGLERALGEGLVPSARDEDRVVPETLPAARSGGDRTSHFSDEHCPVAAALKTRDGAKVRTAVSVAQQLEDRAKPPEVEEVRRVDSRETLEGRDEQARVFDQHESPEIAHGVQFGSDHAGEVVRLRFREAPALPANADAVGA
jgi:hypothetical protein